MTLSRRRFLTIASAACLVAPAAHAYRWEGIALGARAQIVLDNPRADDVARRAALEIGRLEDIFSLYRPASEIRRLNDAGRLSAPSFELLECLSVARRVHRTTGGRFDPTVQPLWRLLSVAHAQGVTPDAAAVGKARGAIGFERVTFDEGAVTLAPGQALTLNGIAQGYIADRVAFLMRNADISDVLIDTGEIVALGAQAGRAGWPVTIEGEDRARALSGRALATSAPRGTVLDRNGTVGHILDPRSGAPVVPGIRQISVSAPQAALADGLSTGLCLARDEEEARRLLSQHKEARLESLQVSPKAPRTDKRKR